MTPYQTRSVRRMRRWNLKGYPSPLGAHHYALFTLFSLDEAARADPVLAEYMRTILGSLMDGKHLPRPAIPAPDAVAFDGDDVTLPGTPDGVGPGALGPSSD